MQTHFPLLKGKVRYDVLPRDFWGLLLMPFIMGVMTVSYVGSLSKIMVIYGLLLSFLYVLYFLYHRSELQPEVLIYFIWIAWSLGGLTNVINSDLYLKQMGTIIQIGVLIFIVSGIAAQRRDISFVMLAMGAGGIMVAGSSIATGEFQKIALGLTSTRSEGLTGNANEFAYCLLFVIFAVLFFWKKGSSLSWKISLGAVGAFTSFFIIFSGSRKTFAGELFFIFMWWLFCKEKRLSRNMIAGYLLLVLFLGGTFFGTEYVLSRTNIGKRFEQMGDSGNRNRIEMYKEGLEMIKKNPVFGLGLNNYRAVSSSGLYSHSDYIEVVSTTGIVGGLLYFSVYFVLWLRLGRIKAMTRDPELSYNVGFLKAAIITLLLVGFGRVNIISKVTWIFLASAIGYSWAEEQFWVALRRNRIDN